MRKNDRKHTSARRAATRHRANRRTTTRSTAKGNKTVVKTTKTIASPFARAFIAGCREGQPCWTVITGIAKKTGKSYDTICASLCKGGVCGGQKFNGQWICWPNFKTRTNAAWAKQTQWTLWQNFADWCIASGNCTPADFNKFSATGVQAIFMKHCQNLLSRQCTIIGASKAGKSTATPTNAKNPQTWANWQSKPLAWTRSFAFPTLKSFTRRYARAA